MLCATQHGLLQTDPWSFLETGVPSAAKGLAVLLPTLYFGAHLCIAVQLVHISVLHLDAQGHSYEESHGSCRRIHGSGFIKEQAVCS